MGYVEPKDGNFAYIYQYKDHLGNIRLAYADEIGDGSPTIKEENNYYPFGLKHKGYNEIVRGRDHKFGFQKQEEQNDLGLDWIQFKWRNHDPATGRFMSIDPLSEKYVHNSTYAFAENKVIAFIELEGLEGLHYTETLDDGSTKHTIEKNILVLLKKPLEIPKGADEKQVAKIGKKNKRRGNWNKSQMSKVKNDLSTFYSDAKNSKGEVVEFKFNISSRMVDNPKKEPLSQRNDAIPNGLQSSEKKKGHKGIVPAAIITTQSTRGNIGLTTGGFRIHDIGSEDGTTSHEVLHTLGVPDNDYGSGGLLNSPPGHISQSEVDDVIKNSYKKE